MPERLRIMRCLLTLLFCLFMLSPAKASGGEEKDGWVLFRQRDYSAALKRFEVDVNKFREWAELRDAMGWCHYFLGEYEAAEERFKEALELEPDYKWSLEGLEALEAVRKAPLAEANTLLATCRYQEARSAYQRIQDGQTAADSSSVALALRGEAWCWYYLGDYAQAVKAFRDARKKLGKDPESLRGMAYCQYAQADYRHALTSLSLSLELEPEDYVARLTAGWCHYWMGKYDKARKEFGRAIESDSAPWSAHVGLGWCAFRADDTSAALRAFEQALKLSPYAADSELEAVIEARPDWRPLRNAIGWAALRENLSSWALTEFETSELLDCDKREALAGQAFALFNMSRYDEALQKAKSLHGSPEHKAVHVFRTALPEGGTAEVATNVACLEGWIAQRQGRYDDALTLFREVRRAQPEWPDPACGEGWALYAQGNYPAAEQAFDAALELLPGYSDANSGRAAIRAWRYGTYDRGWASYYAGDYYGALRSFQAILDDARDPFPRTELDLVQASLGWSQFRAGDAKAAERSFKRALDAQPDQGLAHKGRGFVALEQEQWSAAARHLSAAVATPEIAEDAEAWTHLGRARLNDRQIKEANEALDKAVELSPQLAMAHAWQGLARQADGDSVEARIALERAIALDPSIANEEKVRKLIDGNKSFYRLHSPLAWAWFYRGDYAAAADEFRSSLEKDPLELSASRGLGLCLLRTGELEAGTKQLESWLRGMPRKEAGWGTWSSTLSELGWSLYAAEEFGDAIKVFKRLHALHDDEEVEFAEPHDGLGWCYLRLRKHREAKRAFLEAIAITPRFESSLKGLEALMEAR